jgi:hypothetical protein
LESLVSDEFTIPITIEPTLTPMKVETPWEFACGWYRTEEIHQCLNRSHRTFGLPGEERYKNIPHDHSSVEFAEWLANEYRLAMTKGIQIGQSESYRQWVS